MKNFALTFYKFLDAGLGSLWPLNIGYKSDICASRINFTSLYLTPFGWDPVRIEVRHLTKPEGLVARHRRQLLQIGKPVGVDD